MKPDSYLIYADADLSRAEALYTALAEAGHETFTRDLHLLPGDVVGEELTVRLEEAGLVLVVVSPADSDWYARDQIVHAIERAAAGHARVVPIVYDGVERGRLPFGLKRLHPIRVNGGDLTPVVDGLARLLDPDAKRAVSRQTRPEKPSAPVSAETVQALLDATIRRRLDRDLLLSWLPDRIRARLSRKDNDYDQCHADLIGLIRAGRLDDGQWAIAVWLRQAERMAGPFAEARVYRAALDALSARG